MRTKLFDPTNDPVEPYVRRLRRELNLTQDELAREAGTSRLAVLRNEQLNYHTPLPMIATTLSLVSGNSLKTNQKEYHIDVLKRRRYASEVLLKSSEAVVMNNETFREWRVFTCKLEELPISVIKFSSMICVNPNTITDFERRSSLSKTASVPQALVIAFREMKYPDGFLSNFGTVSEW